MDKFLSGEEIDNIKNYGLKPAAARQYGLTTMAVYDCDTIPYLWMYAHNFTLFDYYFQSETGPSSPGNVSMFAGQAGISEEHRFPKLASNQSEGPGVPINGDLDPFAGPYTGKDTTVQIPQSYATLGARRCLRGPVGRSTRRQSDERSHGDCGVKTVLDPVDVGARRLRQNSRRLG
jgi:phospholipase C